MEEKSRPGQRRSEAVSEFVGNMDEGHARVKMSEVKAHLNETYFAWIMASTKSSDEV